MVPRSAAHYVSLVDVWGFLIPTLLLTRAQVATAADDIQLSVANASEEFSKGVARHCTAKMDLHGVWNGSTAPGGVYVLTCDPGYGVDGKRQWKLTCSETQAQWPADPWCENLDDCASLIYACGPEGLCVDHVGHSECLCEHGAKRHTMDNGEVVCNFTGSDCGGKTCGAHGICVDLTQYEGSFDTGNDTYRCSCQDGFTDNGTECVARSCGRLHDSHGSWTGRDNYLGEYTLACQKGATVWGGTQSAVTVSCPPDGLWSSNKMFHVSRPKCLSLAAEARKRRAENIERIINVVMALVCVSCAALAAGLTMGLVSLEPRELEIIVHARVEDCLNDAERERLEMQKEAARRILPLRRNHHLLLVTLLLLNALSNEALPVFLDELVGEILALLLSVTFVLVCGEILPAALFTGPQQLVIAARFIPCVRILQCLLYFIAKPIAVALDKGLPHKDPEEDFYTRPEIRAVLGLHCGGARALGHNTLKDRNGSGDSLLHVQGTISTAGSTRASEDPLLEENSGPLDPLEVELCYGILDLGETQVCEGPGFQSLRSLYRTFRPVERTQTLEEAVGAAAIAGVEGVVVFKSLERVRWPVEVPIEECVGFVLLPELLAAGPSTTLDTLCGVSQVVVQATDMVTDAIDELCSINGTPYNFALVKQKGEFIGLFDGQEAMLAILYPKALRHQTLPVDAHPLLSQETVEAISAGYATKTSGDGSKIRISPLATLRERPSELSLANMSEHSHSPDDLSLLRRTHSGHSSGFLYQAQQAHEMPSVTQQRVDAPLPPSTAGAAAAVAAPGVHAGDAEEDGRPVVVVQPGSEAEPYL